VLFMNHQNLKKNMIWNAAGNLIYLGCQWLITVLVARSAQFEAAGVLSVALSMSATFQTLANFGIRSFQVSDVENRYTDNCYVFFRVIACSVAMVACLLTSVAVGYRSETLLCIALYMLFRIAESLSDVLHGIAQKNDRLDVAGKSFAIKGIGLLVLFVAGYLWSDRLSVGLAGMAVFSCASTLLYDLTVTRRLASFRFFDYRSGWLALAKETWPLCAYLFLSSAIVMLPRLILEQRCGEEILGIYASVFAPATLIQAAMGYVYNPFAQLLGEYRARGDRKAFLVLSAKIMVAIAAVAGVMVAVASFAGKFLLGLLLGEAILPHTDLLIPILLAIALISIFGFLCMLAIVLRAFFFLLVGCAVGLALCALITVPMIDKVGMNAPSYALILSALVASVVLTAGILQKLFQRQK